jgi:hypothetical protein
MLGRPLNSKGDAEAISIIFARINLSNTPKN